MIVKAIQVLFIFYVYFFEDKIILAPILIISLLTLVGQKVINANQKVIGPIVVPIINSKKLILYGLVSLGVFFMQNIKVLNHSKTLIISIILVTIIAKMRVKNDI